MLSSHGRDHFLFLCGYLNPSPRVTKTDISRGLSASSDRPTTQSVFIFSPWRVPNFLASSVIYSNALTFYSEMLGI